jgi:hypothetical protein
MEGFFQLPSSGKPAGIRKNGIPRITIRGSLLYGSGRKDCSQLAMGTSQDGKVFSSFRSQQFLVRFLFDSR